MADTKLRSDVWLFQTSKQRKPRFSADSYRVSDVMSERQSTGAILVPSLRVAAKMAANCVALLVKGTAINGEVRLVINHFG